MNDLKKIKKHYGEEMMHLCRRLFPDLLEKENLLFSLLEEHFAYSKFLANDIIETNSEKKFTNYIYNLVTRNKERRKYIEIDKTPQELLSEAGYDLYECKTENDIQIFKKYYKKNEELCTFNGGRLKKCYVFFAVKKNIDEIKRENFSTPERQDEYGTSVISIQFTKDPFNNIISIKNRYNHTVNNPDATFSNNLDNIIPGLTKSFEKEYDLKLEYINYGGFNLFDYVYARDGKYYKYENEINNIYYGPNNVIIDNFEVKTEYLEKEKYLVIDYFILDLVNKKISLYDETLQDSFVDGLKNITKIEVVKKGSNKLIILTLEEHNKAYIEIDKYNKIIKYQNEFLENVNNNFLYQNSDLIELNISNVKQIGNNFLKNNRKLEIINIENVLKIGDNFLESNFNLLEINLPKVTIIGCDFLYSNHSFININIPNVMIIGDDFLVNGTNLTDFFAPKLLKIGNGFLKIDNKLKKIDLPKVLIIGNSFLKNNEILDYISAPNLLIIGDEFLCSNKNLKILSLPKTIVIGISFLLSNKELKHLILPNIRIIEEIFNTSKRKIFEDNKQSINSNVVIVDPYLKYCLDNKIKKFYLYQTNNLIKIIVEKYTKLNIKRKILLKD